MNEWCTGDPPKVGWYDVLLDGEEDRLQWWVCMMNPRKRHWKNAMGEYMDGHDIRWTGEAEVRM